MYKFAKGNEGGRGWQPDTTAVPQSAVQSADKKQKARHFADSAAEEGLQLNNWGVWHAEQYRERLQISQARTK